MTNRRINQRYFTNPYPDFREGNTDLNINKTLVKKYALELMDIVLESKGSKDGDGGVYVGAIGATYMYLHVAHNLSLEEKQKYLPLAYNAFQTQSMFHQKNPSGREDLVAFLLGKAGFYAVGAVLGKEIGNEDLVQECINGYFQGANICKPINFLSHGGDELLVGRAGYLCGALWIQQKLGYIPIPENDLKDIWNSMIESGKMYARSHSSPSPLMYSYYDVEYLGAAHGLSGILQILLSFPKFLKENSSAEKLIKDSIDYYLTLQDNLGNFPSAMDEIGTGRERNESNMLVHWCHGAPGSIYLFAKAFQHYKDKKYLNACIKCGDIVWNRGLLYKGPGLCHGVSGNGYVFLIIYNLLEQKEEKYLYRAYKFYEFLNDSRFIKEARRPDGPYSLYEGIAGTACYAMDILQPEKAEFPFFNINNNFM